MSTNTNRKRPGGRKTASIIKMEEVDAPAGTITDIQNYLETFNKEIQSGDPNLQQVTEVQQVLGREAEGTYFVDEAGQYYYQASGDDTPVMVSGIGDTEDPTYVTVQPQDDSHIGEISVLDGNDEDVAVGTEPSQMILNTGNEYQAVTIVPSDNGNGDVSYVLIVQQPDEDGSKENDEQDVGVYDFDEAEEGGIAMESGEEDDKTKIIKIIPRKPQLIKQAHMCNYCNYTSPKRYLLSRHMKSHSEERPHKCSVCERGFKTLPSLQNHVNTHTGTKPHHCKFCESAFTTSGELVRHVRYKHTHEKPHKCTICEYASVEFSKLRNHMRCHTGERPYQCPHCTYASPDTFKLKRHLRIHTGEKPYECNFCHARFTQSNSLKSHRLIHTGDKPAFQCELCPTTCGRKTDLRIHVQKLHTSDVPLKCRRCGKSFPDRYSYKIHNKSHDGEKCFKCDLCPYASISQRHLESHMLIHTDQKPFQCEQCDQQFRQKQLLRRHQNLYHNPNYVPPPPKEKRHECPECGKGFRHKGNLIRHMAVHDPESEAHTRAALRQKKYEFIDGRHVEVYDEDDLNDEDNELMAVKGEDGQQYVVLEVIQLQDDDGGGQTAVAVMTDNDTCTLQSLNISEENLIDEHITPGYTKDGIIQAYRAKKAVTIKQRLETEKDMETCFGFDDGDDVDDEEVAKTTIQLLEAM